MNKETHQLPSILIVDDDEIDVRALRRAWKKRALSNPIYSAENGRAALDMLLGKDCELDKPYIVLLDINMPVMDGMEFLEALRSEPSLHDTVVFVLTTSDDERDIKRAYKKHIAGYLVKDRVGEDFRNLISLLESLTITIKFPRRPMSTNVA